MEGTTIEVLGVPDDLLVSDRMVDKLTIHFLRPRNGGGEVQTVVFPAYRPGQAWVIFAESEVASRVLRQTHFLDVEGQRFPLQVKRHEVDMSVKATLDVTMFPSQVAVRRLLDNHSFQVTDLLPGQLLVEGSFLNLRAVKAQLQLLLPRNSQTHSNPHPFVVNGYISGVKDHASGAFSKSSIRGQEMNYTSSTNSSSQDSGYPHSQSTQWKGLPPGANVTHRRKQSLRLEEPASHTPSRKSVSFVTDADVLRYALCFRKNDIDAILQSHHSQIDVKHEDNSDISTVVLEGKQAESAMEKLQTFLTHVTTSLRTQEIDLPLLDYDSQVAVNKRIQKYRDIYPTVIVCQIGDIVRLVGPSSDSYEMKQRLLGKTPELPPAGRTGRQMSRNSRDRRSSSLTRLSQRQDAPLQSNHDPVPPTGASGYSPSDYQDDHRRGRTEPNTTGPAPPASTSRGRSSSETRSKANERKEALRQEQGALAQRTEQTQNSVVAPSGGHKAPLAKFQSKMHSIFNPKNMSNTDIKKKLTKSYK
ncbi:hypothetical protein UPYG_G00331930 [Umbra pygmaea]|uniref:PAR14-like first RRM domain-containing protein n=1 Tax=Umbra pygmaea TaxID=75934 RepID=A0ABD0VZU1_UMBPY